MIPLYNYSGNKINIYNMNRYRNRFITILFWYTILVALIVWLFSSCSVMHKSKSSTIVKKDSTVAVVVKKAVKKNTNSKKKAISKEKHNSEVDVYFDKEDKDSSTPVADYFPSKENKPVHIVNFNGNEIKSSRSIDSVKFRIKNAVKTIDLSHITTFDSTVTDTASSIKVTTQTKQTDKKKTGFAFNWWWLLLLIIPVLAYMYFGGRFDSLLVFFRKKTQDNKA